MMRYWVTLKRQGGGGARSVSIIAVDAGSAMDIAAEQLPVDVYERDLYIAGARTAIAIYRYDELMAAPLAGLARAGDLTWQRRDHGLPYLVIERGHVQDGDGYDVWTGTGRIAGNTHTRAAGERLAAKFRAQSVARRGFRGRYDVAARDEIEIFSYSGPYGCNAGEQAA